MRRAHGDGSIERPARDLGVRQHASLDEVMTVERRHPALEPFRRGLTVGVEEREHRAARGVHAGVARRAGTVAALAADHLRDHCGASRQFAGAVARAVVDDDHLEPPVELLTGKPGECAAVPTWRRAPG